ncbi:hypothetical protein V8E53_006209 [Lactarius tabidus]
MSADATDAMDTENLISFETPKHGFPTPLAGNEETEEFPPPTTVTERKESANSGNKCHKEKHRRTHGTHGKISPAQSQQNAPQAKAPPIPRYNIPQTNNKEPPTLPPSPTPDPHKRRRLQPAPDPQRDPPNSEHRMSVDENSRDTHNNGGLATGRTQTENENGSTNTETENRRAENASTEGPQPESTRMEVNEAEVEEILAALEAATENKQTESKLNIYT